AAIGYCFGGMVVLEMARKSLPLKGVISYHGGLGTKKPAKLGALKASVLVFNGAADPMVGEKALKQFEQEMKRAGADFQVVDYPGVKHAFTNPAATDLGKKFDLPLAYDAQADKDSWNKSKVFLARLFK